MFKVGDKVICINTGKIFINNDWRKSINHLKLNNTYTVVNEDGGRDDIEVYEFPHLFYHMCRFKTIQQLRRYKINKIWKNKLDNTS